MTTRYRGNLWLRHTGRGNGAEVKTRSKPNRGDARVTNDGERVLVDGKLPARDPVVQARAGARSLQAILERYAGKKKAVRSVVLFPD